MIHQIDSKNEWLRLPASFTAKFGLVFIVKLENPFSLGFHFKANRKSIGSSKKWHVFMSQSVKILNINTLTLKQIFWKTKTFFKNTGVMFF